MSTLGEMYAGHHASARGAGFVLLGDERGAFLREAIGTGKNVLDIGCRDGALTATYADGNTVTGVDIDAGALVRAQEMLGVNTASFDLNGKWPLPSQTFDAVVAAEVIEHLYYPREVLRKIAAVLKENGTLVGSVPNAFSLRHRMRYLSLKKKSTPLEDPTHINHFTVKELRTLLEEWFELVEIRGAGRYAVLARAFPQEFAFDLLFWASRPKRA